MVKRNESPPRTTRRIDGWKPYGPFIDALNGFAANPRSAQRRIVPVTAIDIADEYQPNRSSLRGFCPNAERFTELRRSRELQKEPVLVLERPDGSLWTYDDAGILMLYREYAPDAKVAVAIIGTDSLGTEARSIVAARQGRETRIK